MFQLNEVKEQSTSYKMFETSFWLNMMSRMLHFLMYPLEMSILTHKVHFHKFYFAYVTIRF